MSERNEQDEVCYIVVVEPDGQHVRVRRDREAWGPMLDAPGLVQTLHSFAAPSELP